MRMDNVPGQATSLRLLLEPAKDFGLDISPGLEIAGQLSGAQKIPTAQVTIETEIQVIESFVGLSPQKFGLGVAVEKRMHVNAFV